MIPVRHRCHLDECNRQKREHQRLNESDEDLEPQERHRQKVWDKERNHHEQILPCKDIAKETEDKGDKACKLSYELKNANHRTNAVRFLPRSDEVFFHMTNHSYRGDPQNLCCDDGDECECQGDVCICIHGAENRNRHFFAVMDSLHGNAPYSWNDAKPVCEDDKEEERCDHREHASCEHPILHHGIDEGEETFDDELQERLKAIWHTFIAAELPDECNRDEDSHRD